MRDRLTARWSLDRFGLLTQTIAFGGGSVVFYEPGRSLLLPLGFGIVAILNGLFLAMLGRPELRAKLPKSGVTHLRLIGYFVVTVSALIGSGGHDRPWMLAIPLVLIDTLDEQNWKRSVSFSLLVGAAQWIGAGHLLSFIAVTPAITLIMASFAAAILAGYREHDELMRSRNRRMSTLMQAASAVADRDVHATALRVLQAAVKDLGATAGFVALASEDDSRLLVTEAAYGLTGNFKFPITLTVGSGVSGYVAKMGQPISVHASEGERVECDGIDLDARAAVSVPLVTGGSSLPGRAMEDETIGAMTLVFCDSSDALDREDLDLLQSVASLLATAIVNQRMEERQRTTFLRTLESLATALEARDDYTRGHSNRVCDVSLLIGQSMGLGPEALEELRIGTTLHDIGKIGVPDAILNKPGRLDEAEFAIMKSHPVIGYEICRPLMLSDGVLMIIRNHHEKLDGSGYPDGLRGGELPLSLRIVCVADAFDAMSSRRPYRGVMDLGYVIGELSKGAGVQFDPVVVETLKELLNSGALNVYYQKFWSTTWEAAA
jgi:hypothetical protein